MNEVDVYKIFRQLEERKKRANPYSFYDKDELIDEILKNEDEIDRLNNIINELQQRIDKAVDYIEKEYEDNIIIADHTDQPITPQDLYQDLLNILKGKDNNDN